MRIIASSLAVAALFISASAQASIVEHRPINGMSDFSIAPKDVPTGCNVNHIYSSKEIGEITCPSEADMNKYFAFSDELQPACKATENGIWKCTVTKS